MSRRLLPLLAIALIASACSVPLGRDMPECDTITTAVVLEVQSVPGAAYVSCIEGLRTGWDFHHVEARSGHSVFWLDSDRMGDEFLTVENLLSCDITNATRAGFYDSPIDRYTDVVSKTTVDVVLIPEGRDQATADYATEIQVQLQSTEIRGNTVAVTVSVSDESTTAARVVRATASGAHVMIIGVRDAEEETLTLILSGDPLERETTLEDAIETIEDVETESSYRGKWYHVFEGGCIVYTFDAEGAGVDTIERDIGLSLGFHDAEELRRFARDAGYNLP